MHVLSAGRHCSSAHVLHILQVDQMADTQTTQKLRRLMGQSEGTGSGDGPRAQPQQQTSPARLPSSNNTARHSPRLSEQCYQLATLAHLPKAERSPDFAAAAISVLQAPLSRVQDVTGLQTLQQDHKTGQLAVSLTGGHPGSCRLTKALPADRDCSVASHFVSHRQRQSLQG
jgi:hypothetical protein